jgi:hypothetical protein
VPWESHGLQPWEEVKQTLSFDADAYDQYDRDLIARKLIKEVR